MASVTKEQNCYFYLILVNLNFNSLATYNCGFLIAHGSIRVYGFDHEHSSWILDLHPELISSKVLFSEAYPATWPSLLVK